MQQVFQERSIEYDWPSLRDSIDQNDASSVLQAVISTVPAWNEWLGLAIWVNCYTAKKG